MFTVFASLLLHADRLEPQGPDARRPSDRARTSRGHARSSVGGCGPVLFGLCDLGLGFPELGWVSLRELAKVCSMLGLPIAQDLHLRADKRLGPVRRKRAWRGPSKPKGPPPAWLAAFFLFLSFAVLRPFYLRLFVSLRSVSVPPRA